MNPFPSNKRAQITVFIIIGVILVFSIGIYSYLKSTGVGPADFFQPKSPPVVAYIEECLSNTAKDAIFSMGNQGGYIELPPTIALNPTRYVSMIPGTSGEFAPKVPLWYFEGESQIPSQRYMEVEVERYIDVNLENCLNNYQGLRDEYIITELSNYSAKVVFAEAETIIGLDYEVEIQPKGAKEVTKKEQFLVRLDVKIKRMRDVAEKILEAENDNVFFERLTINLMASHPSDDIPFTGLTLHCGRLQWLLSDIKKKMIFALEPTIPAVRFRNTEHEPFEAKDDDYAKVHEAVEEWRESEKIKPLRLPSYIPSDSYDYFQYYFNFTEDDYSDLRVISSYRGDWGMNLLATPNEHGILKSGVQDLRSQILTFLCLNTYHFVYDVSYPIMISIHDDDAFHKTGYTFRFAFPVQIFHNSPDRGLLPTRIIEPTEYALDYCDSYAAEDSTIIARDSVTNAELSRVNLSFRCLTELCILGTTRTNNRHLQWSGKFPAGCSGAVIIANRSGYLETEKQHDGSEPFYIDMPPTQSVVFDVRRHPENAPDSARFLEPNMYAILQLEHRDPPMSIFELFDTENMFNRSKKFDLLRADATYYVNIMLIQKVGADEDIMIGGWMGNWTVELEDILDARKVVFHIPQKYPPPKTPDEIIAAYEMMTNRTLFPVEPEIIRADEYTPQDDEEIVT
jgi:hypothetical protein